MTQLCQKPNPSYLARVLDIRPLTTDAEARLAAETMATSEPWLTLGRGFEESLALVHDPTREVYVAYDGDTFRGFLILSLKGARSGYVQTVAVTADARGRGIGSQLMAFAEERIFRDFPNVFLCVSSFNTRARAMYERLGYEVIGELKDYLVRGHSEILMRKSIGPIGEFTRRTHRTIQEES
jgi:[ribosomal protein S18]-alanine N-acetyltransferase